MDKRSFNYTIDNNDYIISVNQDWMDFAQENGAPALTNADVLKNSLWNFISDTDTRQIYRELLDRVRSHNETQKIVFRCDAPECLRIMQLQLIPAGSGSVEFVSTTLEEKKRDPIAFLGAAGIAHDEFVTLCSWCKKIEIEGVWWDLDEAVNHLALLTDTPAPGITHGICSDCKNKLLGKTDN